VTDGFYPLSGNPSGFLTASSLTPYLSKAGNLAGLTDLTTARDNLNLGTNNSPTFSGLTALGSGGNVAQLTPTSLTLTQPGYGIFTFQPSQGIVFPDATIQTTAFNTSLLSAYLLKSGGTMTGDIQSNNNSAYRSWNGTYNTAVLKGDYLQFTNSDIGGNSLTVEWNGITFPSGKQTVHYPGASILDGFATESWVTSGFYPLTGNPGGFIADAPSDSAYYARRNAGWEQVLGADAPWDGKIYGRQDGFWAEVSGGGGGGTWGSITGTLSSQTDLQSALDAKYDASNPAGFITFGDLTGFATESWVTGQGYITSGYLANIQTDIGFDTSIGTPQTQRLFLDGVCELTPGSGITQARLNFSSNSNPNAPVSGDMWVNHTYGLYVVWGGITNLMASQIWVQGNLNLKASLSGANFTGKVNLATIGVATPSINLGGQCDSAPASAANGDLWISNATAPKLTYRMAGVNYNLPVLNQFNTFTNQMVIDTTSATTAALRVTQRGTGNAIEVEDSTTPDATKFVVDQFGKVGVGTAPDATAAIKVDASGISFNGLVFNPTATSAHTGGSDTLDLLVTINGTNYRLGLRPA
jgi:hypothetical protein